MAVTKPWLTELEIYHRLVSGVEGVSGVSSPSLPLGVGKWFSSIKRYHLLEVVKKQAVAKITDFNLLEFLKLLHFLLEKLVKNNLQGLSHSFLSADNH